MSAENTSSMATAFDPQPVETKWSQIWLDEKLGQPRPVKAGERPFVVTIPPPNVTGVLHLGHALQHAIHDCLARYHRMKGEATLVVPGTDHAGIATQVKVETLLRSQGTSREALGREKFVALKVKARELEGSRASAILRLQATIANSFCRCLCVPSSPEL